MINMKKRFYLFTFLLTFGLLLFPFGAEAHYHSKFLQEYEQLDNEKKQQVDKILNDLHSELENLGVKIPHLNAHLTYSQLDEETKEQVKQIIKELEEGKITSEQADEKLYNLGVISPKDEKCKIYDGLDEGTKQKVKEIMKQMKSGSITKEQAEEKLEELGVEMPKEPQLDEETREKVKQIVEEAEKEFENLGIEFPKEFYKRILE